MIERKDATPNTHPILVTGSHRGGTTWVGKMLDLSMGTYYVGEVFHPHAHRLPAPLLDHWFQYVCEENGQPYLEPLRQILTLSFRWRKRRGLRRFLPSRLILLQQTRRWFGYPRPIMKDPIAAFSAEWLAKTFNMDVVFLVRHPAAFVASLKRARWPVGFRTFLTQPRLVDDLLYPYVRQMENPPADFAERAALLWLCINHVLSTYAQRNAGWLNWRLEDVSEDPAAVFRSIYCDLGLKYTHRIQRAIGEYSSEKNLIEPNSGDLHLIRRNSRQVQKRWRALLSSVEVASIRRVAEPVSHLYYGNADW